MKAIYLILPFLLIAGGFIGMALSLPAAGWAVLVGLLLYPTGFSSSNKGDNKNDN